MEKSYDMIIIEFLLDIMRRRAFGPKWMTKIDAHISNGPLVSDLMTLVVIFYCW